MRPALAAVAGLLLAAVAAAPGTLATTSHLLAYGPPYWDASATVQCEECVHDESAGTDGRFSFTVLAADGATGPAGWVEAAVSDTRTIDHDVAYVRFGNYLEIARLVGAPLDAAVVVTSPSCIGLYAGPMGSPEGWCAERRLSLDKTVARTGPLGSPMDFSLYPAPGHASVPAGDYTIRFSATMPLDGTVAADPEPPLVEAPALQAEGWFRWCYALAYDLA